MLYNYIYILLFIVFLNIVLVHVCHDRSTLCVGLVLACLGLVLVM